MTERVTKDRLDIQSSRIVVGTADVADGNHRKLRFAQELCGMCADVAKALDRNLGLLRLPAEPLHQFDCQQSYPTTCRLFSPFGAILFHGLAGDHRGVETMVLLPLVSKPRHHSMIGSHIGRGDVGVGSHDVVDLINEGSRQTLDLTQ